MNNNIQVIIKSSTTEMSLNDHEAGIYIVPELNGLTGLPNIRTTSGVNAGYDGGWTTAQNYDARSIVVRGVIANEDKSKVEQMRKQLVTLLGQGKKEPLTFDIVTETGKAYELQVRTIACDMAMQRVLTRQDFMLTFRADDVLIYDNSAAGEPVTIQVQKALGGFQIDFELPLAIGGSEDAGIVENNGQEEVFPIVKLYGALHNPTIINQTTNQQMQLDVDLGYAQGAPINPVDVSGKTININDGIEASLESVQIDGETSQQTYTGKNLLDYPSIVQTTRNGITSSYDANTQTIMFNGTCDTDNTTFAFEDFMGFQANGTYTISYELVSGTITNPTVNTRLQFQDSNHGWSGIVVQLVQGNNSNTGNLSSLTFTLANVRFDNGVAVNNYKIRVQFEKSNQATSWEPYVGGIPAPNPGYPQAVNTVTGENVVKICGKNLFDKTAVSTGYINADTTLSTDMSYRTSDYIPVIPNTAYYKTLTQSPRTKYFDINKKPLNTTTYQDISIGGYAGTFTTPNNAAYLRFSFPVTSGGGGTPVDIDTVQIELGSTATTYEPYRGQSYEVNLGKNLFDKTNVASLDGYPSATTITSNNYHKTIYIKCEPNTTYTVQKINQGNNKRFALATTATLPAIGGSTLQFDQDNNADSITITTNSSARYLLVWCYVTNDAGVTWNEIINSLQIEKGSQYSSYAAYFTPIELCKIGTYQDYIYKSGGKWYVRKETGKYVYNNDLGTNGISATRVDMLTPALPIAPNTSTQNIAISNMYGSIITNNTGLGGTTALSLIRIMTSTSIADSYDAVRALAAANNLTIYYALATPTDTEITNEALITQLDNLASAALYSGTNNIFTVTANEVPTLELGYYTDRNPDIRDEVIIDSRLRTITLNGMDIYNLQAEGSEFLMLAPGQNRLLLRSDNTSDNGYAEVNYKQGYLSI